MILIGTQSSDGAVCWRSVSGWRPDQLTRCRVCLARSRFDSDLGHSQTLDSPV
jgi:hypothetical protein